MRDWVRQADIDDGGREGLTTSEGEELAAQEDVMASLAERFEAQATAPVSTTAGSARATPNAEPGG